MGTFYTKIQLASQVFKKVNCHHFLEFLTLPQHFHANYVFINFMRQVRMVYDMGCFHVSLWWLPQLYFKTPICVFVLLSVVFWLHICPLLLLLPFPCFVMTFLGCIFIIWRFFKKCIYIYYLILFIAQKNHQKPRNDSKISPCFFPFIKLVKVS